MEDDMFTFQEQLDCNRCQYENRHWFQFRYWPNRFAFQKIPSSVRRRAWIRTASEFQPATGG